MRQVKILQGKTLEELNTSINEFLAQISSESYRSCNVDTPNSVAVIEYEIKDAWADRMCSECKYWDDSGSSDSVSGLCHECGKRRRFNCKACKKYKDVRG